MSTFKLRVEGEFKTQEEAIEKLADRYMSISQMAPPGESIPELICNKISSKAENLCKHVWLEVLETNKYGREQWMEICELNIYPFKDEHWQTPMKYEDFIPPKREFKYEIAENTKN